MKNIIVGLLAVLSIVNDCFAQEKSQNDVYARNIAIVFDSSGSMDEKIDRRTRKIDAAKAAIRQVVASLPASTNVGLFIFGGGVRDNAVPIGPKNDATFSDAIAPVYPNGSTPLTEYIRRAADQILLQREKNLGYGWYQIIVVTDGEADNKSTMVSVAKETLRRGIALDVVGVGMTSEHTLAKVSTSYRAANDIESLNKALTEIVAETTVMTDANVNDDFEIIKSLSDEQCKTILTTLGSSENQPLFEKPKTIATVSQQSDSSTATVNSNPPIQNPSTFSGTDIVIIILSGITVVSSLVIIIAKISG